MYYYYEMYRIKVISFCDMESVYCAVRPESLTIFVVIFALRGLKISACLLNPC
jgi:hypothetical protein